MGLVADNRIDGSYFKQRMADYVGPDELRNHQAQLQADSEPPGWVARKPLPPWGPCMPLRASANVGCKAAASRWLLHS